MFLNIRALSVLSSPFPTLLPLFFYEFPVLFPSEFDQFTLQPAFSFNPRYLGNQLVTGEGINCLLTGNQLRCLHFFHVTAQQRQRGRDCDFASSLPYKS